MLLKDKLVLRPLAVVGNAVPETLGHGVGQLFEQGRLQVSHPHPLDGGVEEGHEGDGVVVLQLPLHD